MKKIFALCFALVAVIALAEWRYNSYIFFDGSQTITNATFLQFHGTFKTNLAQLTDYETNYWFRSIGPVKGTNLILIFGCRNQGVNTNQITLAGASVSLINNEYTWRSTSPLNYTNNGSTAYGIWRDGTTWKLTNVGGTLIAHTEDAGNQSNRWVYDAVSATPPYSYWSGESVQTNANVVLALAASYDGSNWVNDWRYVTNKQTNVLFTYKAYPYDASNYAYFKVHAGTNYADDGSAITNAYLKAFVKE